MNSSREQLIGAKEDTSLDSIKQLAKKEANGTSGRKDCSLSVSWTNLGTLVDAFVFLCRLVISAW